MPNSRDTVFDRVIVDHITRSGTRVSWEMGEFFNLLDPHTFQLQVSTASVPTANDWEDVGSTITNAFFAIDDEQRNFGGSQHTHYRVRVTTPNGTWYSAPAHTYGVLRARDWNLARAMIRKLSMVHQHYTAPDGFLLRRKWVGTQPDPKTWEVDPLTDEPIKTKNTSTYGTEYVGGYYTAVPLRIEFSPETRFIRQDNEGGGTVNKTLIKGLVVPFPQLNTRDIWAHASSDVRYAIQSIEHKAEIRGVPIMVEVTLRPLGRKDEVYRVPLS